MVSLPLVRRYEAAGFRAWPASSVSYDGAWQIRLTPGHASRRANCLVPLDPGDTRGFAERISSAETLFHSAGRDLVVRQTPLCPAGLKDYLVQNGFLPEGEVSVQTLPLSGNLPQTTMDIIPSHDVTRFVDACLEIEKDKPRNSREAMQALFSAIQPETGLFILSEGETSAKAVAICVHDGDLAGLQQVAVAPSGRRNGLGSEITAAALKWAKLRGASSAWLQVETANEGATALYAKLGFTEVYRYCYWRKKG